MPTLYPGSYYTLGHIHIALVALVFEHLKVFRPGADIQKTPGGS